MNHSQSNVNPALPPQQQMAPVESHNSDLLGQWKAALSDIRFWRSVVVVNGFVPLVILLYDGYSGNLGANSVNNALHITGLLSLVFLYLSLVITPIRRVFGWGKLVALRRALGLFGFLYAVIHFGLYVGFDRALNLSSTIEEITSRRFLQLGFIAVVLMVPLAVTSTNGMVRRLGGKRWKLLHKLAYVVVILGVAHYYLLVKSDVRNPIAFAVVLTPLLGFRLADHYVGLRKSARQLASRSSEFAIPEKPKFWKGKLRVARVFQETHDVKTFRFQTPDGSALPFHHRPGQYLTLQLPIDGSQDSPLVRRSYTISSSPEQAGFCEISVKREALGAGSRALHDRVKEGDVIEVAAPAGQFVFDDGRHAPVALIAGGVGITPMMSTARALTERSWPGQIYFVFVTRGIEDIIFKAELEAMNARFDNFHLLVTLTRPPATDAWKGGVGRLDQAKLREFIPHIVDSTAMVCGPQGMMDATCELLREIGVPESRVMTEAFASPTTDRDAPVTPTTFSTDTPAASTAVVTFEASGVTTTVSTETNILEAAEAVGIDLPFECRSGICGQCKVECLDGRVHMPVQDALSPGELAGGDILACQAVPRSDEVKIRA